MLAVIEGLGAHPARRAVVGIAMILACLGALGCRASICGLLRERPSLVMAIAAAQLGLAAVDGLVGSPYIAFTLTSLGIAAVVARARTVWACVALLCLGYLVIALIGHPPPEFSQNGRLGTTLGAVIGYIAAAVPLMLLRGRFTWIRAHAEMILDEVRHGAPAFTPALGAAINRAPLALPAPSTMLTPTERAIVLALASGLTPKEIALERGRSLPAVRSHLSNAKRKTGARTLPELVAIVLRIESPLGDRDGT